MKLCLSLILIAGYVLIFAGCKSATSPSGGVLIQQMFPLSVGDTWTYRDRFYNPDGTISQTDDTMTVNIVTHQQINGNDVYSSNLGSGFYYGGSNDLFRMTGQSVAPKHVLHIMETRTIIFYRIRQIQTESGRRKC